MVDGMLERVLEGILEGIPFRNDREQKVARMWLQGHKVAVIAQSCKWSYGWVQEILRKYFEEEAEGYQEATDGRLYYTRLKLTRRVKRSDYISPRTRPSYYSAQQRIDQEKQLESYHRREWAMRHFVEEVPTELLIGYRAKDLFLKCGIEIPPYPITDDVPMLR